ncbi:MAG: hypothetical protein CMH56_05455 [Myxococcales bacterium]|nr:hypothetical protein [Myxococcales bacterium]
MDHRRLHMCPLLFSLALFASVGHAQTDETVPVSQEVPGPTGWDFAALPLLNFTTDRGVGYGAYAATFFHGDGHSERQPYWMSVGAQFYQTTGDYAFHKLLFDFPNMFNSGVRLDIVSGYETWDSAWYFGLGDATPRLPQEDTPEQFYESEIQSLWVVPTLRFPIAPQWQLYWGNTFRNTQVGAYPGSRLEMDQPSGIEGGLLFLSAAGLMVDTRNKEPNTHHGIFSELSMRLSHPSLGSQWSYWGANLTHRQWVPILEQGRLVFAYRLGLDYQTGHIPFFHQHVLGGSQWVDVGGNLAFRGFPNGRYRGNLTAFGNFEMRGLPVTFHLFQQQVDVYAVAFTDLGRVWLLEEFQNEPLNVRASFGAGPRLSYNDLFVIRLDVAVAFEDYTTPQDPVGTQARNREPILGVYGIVNHPF